MYYTLRCTAEKDCDPELCLLLPTPGHDKRLVSCSIENKKELHISSVKHGKLLSHAVLENQGIEYVVLLGWHIHEGLIVRFGSQHCARLSQITVDLRICLSVLAGGGGKMV